MAARVKIRIEAPTLTPEQRSALVAAAVPELAELLRAYRQLREQQAAQDEKGQA